jgi:hypothetical protein
MRRTSIRALAARSWTAACVALLAALALASAAGAQQFTWRSPITLENSGGTQAAEAVACPSASQCTSVDANGQQVTFNPTTGVTTGSSSIDLRGLVSSIACPSTTQCTAVDNLGNQVTFNPVPGSVVGGGLQTVGSANPLTSVACPLSTQCTAVDTQGNQVTFDPTTGASGGDQSLGGTLAGVACSADGTACVAVSAQGNEVRFSPTGAFTPSTKLIDAVHALTALSCKPDLTLCSAINDHGQQITFNPTTGTGAQTIIDGAVTLTGISCASDYAQCTAVDGLGSEITFNPAGGAVTSSQSVDGITRLNGVACPAGTHTQCTAVDFHGNEVTFDPTTGTTLPGGPHPVSPEVLAAVACPTAAQCTALTAGGREITFDPTAGVVTGQDGHNSTGPSIIDLSGNRLTGLSCPTAGQCTAVDSGAFEVTFNPQNGKVNAAGTNNKLENGQSLRSVSCPDITQCTAVDSGGSQVTFNPQKTAPDSINNVSPNLIDSSADKQQVSVVCLTDHACVAADRSGNETTFDPTVVNAGTTTQVESGQTATALSCASTTQCTMVDNGGRATTFDPTTIAGTQTPTAGPTVVDGSAPLSSVSCPSASSCVAVDTAGQSVQFSPTVLSAASLERVPEAASLQGVSCFTAYECAAVDTGGNAFAGFLPPLSTAAPTITGTAQQGQTLTEHRGSWANYPASSYAVQWEDCDDSGCSPIPGATGSTYVLQASDVGESIAVQETATNLGGPSQAATSGQTPVVVPLAPVNQGPPAIVGTVAQGQTLNEQHGQWTGNPSGYAVQWQRCDGDGLSCAAIPGATGQSYVPQAADLGRRLSAQETASNAGGTSPAASSPPTAPVAGAAAANILATTYRPSSVTWQSALLHGVLYTQGAPASWQFQYGKTTALGASTPPQQVAAGNNGEIPVQWAVSNLRPAVTYYFRLVETVSPDTYRTAVQSLGPVLHLTTPLVGTLHLQSARLPVKGRRALVGLGCRAPVDCAAQLRITANRWIGKGRNRHRQVLSCALANGTVRSGRSRQVGLVLSSSCLTLISSDRHHTLAGQLVAVSTSGQPGFTQSIQLRG